MKKHAEPHMEMIYSEEFCDYIIKANYKLSDFDRSVINTYFMDNGMRRYDDFQGKTGKIRGVIGEYLSNMPKRKIDESIEVDDNELTVGKYVAIEIITNIWNSYIDKLVENHRWPRQCKDINKYLLEIDLAETIGIKSIKSDLFELYNVLSKRVAILFHQDRDLKISSYSNGYLARANYELLIQGYEKIMGIAFGKFNKSLEIDLSTLTFRESHEMDGIYNWDEDSEIKTITTTVGNEYVKKLMGNFDKNMRNK